jgi:hypothetical protein
MARASTTISKKGDPMRNILKLALIAVTAAWTYAAIAQDSDHELFDQLPRQVQKALSEARQACKEAGAEQTYPDAGLEQIFLDNKKAVVVDWRRTDCEQKGIGRCSTGGCDLDIYIGTRRVFHEQVEQHFISTTHEGRLKLLAVSIGYGGNAQCKSEVTSGPGGLQICDALVFWRDGHWVWQPIK